jgi:positive regulator of sigma E activity
VRRVLAVNEVGARAGDLVVLVPAEGAGLKSNLLVFGLPVVMMVAGVLIGGLVLRKDLWAGILAGAGLALGFGVVKLVDLAAGRSGKALPVVVRKLDPGECGQPGETG